MFIKEIVIDGFEGDVTITRTDSGAHVTCNHEIVCEVGRDEPRESRIEKARIAARPICGADRKGRVNATNSMIHEVLDAIDRVAGC